MDPFPTLRAGAFVTSSAGVAHSSPSIIKSPFQYTTTRVSFAHVRARYGPHFQRAVRMSDGAFQALVGILRPPLPRPGLSAEVRTALALRYMGGCSTVDMCIVFSVHSANVYRHCGQLPLRAPRWVFPTKGGWGGTVCSLKGRRVGRIAAISAVQRGASRVGCGVAFAGMFAAACVAIPGEELSDYRQFVWQFLQERNCNYTRHGIPRSQTVYRGVNIRGDPAYVCTGIPSFDGLGQSNQRYAGIPSHGLQLRTGLNLCLSGSSKCWDDAQLVLFFC